MISPNTILVESQMKLGVYQANRRQTNIDVYAMIEPLHAKMCPEMFDKVRFKPACSATKAS